MTGSHSHAERRPETQSRLGSASLLDIGGDVGAVLVRLAGDTPSGELMACPVGQPDEHFHTGVHLREINGASVWTALFPEVVEGDYSFLIDGTEQQPFSAIGGQVVTLTLE